MKINWGTPRPASPAQIKPDLPRAKRPLMPRLLALLLACGVTGTAPALAQSVPSVADPARIGRDQDLPARHLRDLGAPAAPPVARPDIPAGADEEKFVLTAIDITGLSAYTPAGVLPLYESLLGQEISVATLFEIMAALQNKYLRDGYTLTRVSLPPQDIRDGVARLAVTEGYVAEVILDPSLPDDFVTRDAARRILAMRPLNTLTLERLLLVMNALPRLGAGAILARLEHPDPQAPHAVRLILRNEPVREQVAEITLNNHESVFTGPWAVSGEARAFGLGMPHSVLRATAQASTTLSEQKFASLAYSFPVFGASGATLSFSGSLARTKPGADLSVLDIEGRSRALGVEISYPLIYQRAKILKLDAGFDARNSDTAYLGDLLYDDRLRTLRAGVNYSASDSHDGVTLLDLHYAQGLDILGARKTGSALLSRQDGHSDFRKVTLMAGRLQSLPRDFELYALARGQYAFDPLLSAEEFGFGGGLMGRGYNPSEITGDSGLAATLELRHNSGPVPALPFLRAQPYLFYDIGKVWNSDNGDTTHLSAAAGGAGVRFAAEDGWHADINLAFPLTRPAHDPPGYAGKHGPRLMFEIRKSF